MKILVDIDEVCFDFIYILLDRYNNKYGTNFTIDDITKYDIGLSIGKPGYRIFEEFCTPDIFTNLKPNEGCVEALTKLNKKGYDIAWATAAYIPELIYRHNLLEKYFSFYDHHKLIRCCEKWKYLKCEVIIDDYWDQLTAGNYSGIVYTKPWNKDFKSSSISRIDNWNDIWEIFK